ncbi:hypothetical protein LXL04_033982 [Taraxacum kok-saghyz]
MAEQRSIRSYMGTRRELPATVSHLLTCSKSRARGRAHFSNRGIDTGPHSNSPPPLKEPITRPKRLTRLPARLRD